MQRVVPALATVLSAMVVLDLAALYWVFKIAVHSRRLREALQQGNNPALALHARKVEGYAVAVLLAVITIAVFTVITAVMGK